MVLIESIPLSASVSRVRAILTIVLDNKNMNIRELVLYTKENIGTLFPLLAASKLMGLIKISGTKIKLTKTGILFLKAPYKFLSSKLKAVEPFKTTFILLRKESLTTRELVLLLKHQKIISGDTALLEEEIHHLLNSWCVHAKLISYNAKFDLWSLKK